MAFLSFNPNNAAALEYTAGDDVEAEDVLRKPLPLRYNWVIWEQIMQASDGKAAQ